MKTFAERFADRIDGTNGTVVFNAADFNSIVAELRVEIDHKYYEVGKKHGEERGSQEAVKRIRKRLEHESVRAFNCSRDEVARAIRDLILFIQ